MFAHVLGFDLRSGISNYYNLLSLLHELGVKLGVKIKPLMGMDELFNDWK